MDNRKVDELYSKIYIQKFNEDIKINSEMDEDNKILYEILRGLKIMLDMKFIRENVELVRNSLKNRDSDFDLDLLIRIDEKRRNLLTEVETLKKERNEVSAIIEKNIREKR